MGAAGRASGAPLAAAGRRSYRGETMSNSLQDRLRPDAYRWPPYRRRHPVLAGLMAVLIAAGAAPLLLRMVRPAPPPLPAPPSEVAAVQPGADSSASDTVAPAGAAETVPAPKISPFRRAHPWAAPLNGRYYYPSSCPTVLDMPDLVFYRSERAARAAGLERGTAPGC